MFSHWSYFLSLIYAYFSITAAISDIQNDIKVDSEKLSEYLPNWDSLDKRPLLQWYDDIKIGIIIHWGVYSVPAYGVGAASSSEWFWAYWKGGNKALVDYMSEHFPKHFSYQEFAPQFRAEFFNAEEWADLFHKAGAKYVVLTSKHHEGFTMWPSKQSFSWNSMDVGPHRDIVGELANATRDKGLKFGLYHSMYEWYNPIFLRDQRNNFTSQDYVKNKYMPDMTELVMTYHPSVIWVDGDWDADYTYWNSTYFLAWLYNDSPVKDEVVVNDRWGKGLGCKHGDFYSCQDRYNPGVLQKHKWEATVTLDKKSWGYRRNAKFSDYMTTYELITSTVKAVSCGGNMLINVGPTKDGIIDPIMQQRLLDLGDWLNINSEAIYQSKPWKYQNDSSNSDVWYTAHQDDVYAFVFQWPTKNLLNVTSLSEELIKYSNASIVMLGNEQEQLEWNITNTTVTIKLLDQANVKSQWVWVLRVKLLDSEVY